MYSVDYKGQYPGSSNAAALNPGFTNTGGAQPYMNAKPTCPASGGDYSGSVNPDPPGFEVQCDDGHVAAGVPATYPRYASDVGGIRDATANSPVSQVAGADTLNISFLHRP